MKATQPSHAVSAFARLSGQNPTTERQPKRWVGLGLEHSLNPLQSPKLRYLPVVIPHALTNWEKVMFTAHQTKIKLQPQSGLWAASTCQHRCYRCWRDCLKALSAAAGTCDGMTDKISTVHLESFCRVSSFRVWFLFVWISVSPKPTLSSKLALSDPNYYHLSSRLIFSSTFATLAFA